LSDNVGYYDDADIPIRILTVDDESIIVEEIVDSLILQAIDVTGLCDPGDALRFLAADSRITVLMTDLDMPGLNGLELAEQALTGRSDENALEVVLLTAHADLDSAIDAMRIGVFDLLRKPARILTLKDTLERAHHKAAERRRRHRAGLVTMSKSPESLHVVDIVSNSAPMVGTAAYQPFGDSGGGSFLSVMSHELRTPLNPIIGFSQLIEQQSRTLGEGELKEYARYIREAGESLFELTESMLKFTELRACPPKMVPEWVQPTEVLERVRNQHLKAAYSRYQEIEIEPGVEDVVYTDSDLLIQALAHLVTNAIAFSPQGAAVRLSARALGGEMAFRIADDGPGMSAIEIERALQPFEQLNLRHTRAHGGLGVGLTLAALLAGCLGGRLDLESRPGAGTEAAIWVPLSRGMVI
jgi:signal transduction histidine kinase